MMRKPSQPNRNDTGLGVTGTPSGTLFLVGVPIGHPDDLSLRAAEVLKHVVVVAAKTPLSTERLLAHHGIRQTVTSYGPHHLEEKITVLLQRLKQGQDVALVSDCGMPGIYHPGERLVTAARNADLPVRVIPGPSALTAAVACSGYSGNALIFEGHPPDRQPALLRFLARFKDEQRTAVFFVPRASVAVVLAGMAHVLPTRHVTLCVDLTLPGETVHRGKPVQVLRQVESLSNDARLTLVLRGKRKSGRA
ncbi:MAG TPA: SAM-dependent methyltransferase [Nitrospira sp.]|nr:SAM-dependent methyltransferase [Nitrospira sp.]